MTQLHGNAYLDFNNRCLGNSMSDATSQSIHELIEECKGVVVSLAHRIRRNVPVRIDIEDLIAYGNLGLAEAARDFDPSQGNKFITFAYYRIQGAIYDGLTTMTWGSKGYYRKMRYAHMANQVLEQSYNDRIDSDNLSENAAWFARTTEQLSVVYLVSGLNQESDALREAVSKEEMPEEQVQRIEVSEQLRCMVKSLPENESRLIELIYFEGLSLQDASSRIGVSKSWGSRMHAKILEDLARRMRFGGLVD
jgi:RNA polymerase sigma factor for flagellar operon FliA